LIADKEEAMIRIGTVSSIWRYPVKGMAGESLASADIGSMGVSGDRILAVQDVARQEIQSSLVIGDVTVKLGEAAPRCGAVVRKQQGFSEDRSILRSIVRDADQNLGVYGDILATGAIHAGDQIYLV
jgi:uncharacterized protein YcbX